MGISLLDCADPDPKAACRKVYDKICRRAQNLVATGQTIEKEFGIPIVNKRVSVTPISLVASASDTADYAPFAAALDKAAKTIGINFIGGFSALVQKGFTQSDRKLIASIPEALATDVYKRQVNILRIGLLAYATQVSLPHILLSLLVFFLFQVFVFGRLVGKHTRRILGYWAVSYTHLFIEVYIGPLGEGGV